MRFDYYNPKFRKTNKNKDNYMSFFIDHSNLKISCNILLSFCIIIVISFSFAKPATAQKQTPPPIWMQTQNAIEATQTAFAEMQIMFGLQQTQIAWSQTEEAWMQKSTEYASTMSVLNPTRTPEPSIKPTAAEQHNFNVKVGDILRFGQYEQDNNKRNGKELIEWQVLAIEDDRALLISKYALETKEYHEKDEDVTWETCSLRKWLNEDFYKKVFSYDEKSRILEIRNTNPNNPDYGTSGGKDTKDRIFLLSVEESEKYFSNTKDARCEATAYAKANGAYVVSFGYPSDGTSYCWLRTPGESMDFASCVTFYGPIKGLSYIGHWVGWYENVVRPSLWLDLTEDPGKINKIPTKTPTATIVPTNTKTPTRTPRPTATKTPTRTPRPTNGPIGGSGSGTGRY